MGIIKKSVIGMDMDSREIRAVEVKGSVKNPEILAWGQVDLPEGVIKDGRVLNVEVLTSYIEKLIVQNKFKSKDVFLGINNQDVIIRFASFPKVPDDKVRNMIIFQAQEFIPVSLEDLQLDYVIVGEKHNEEGTFLNVILVGARKKMLHDYIQAITGAKLYVKEIDSSMLAVGRAALSAANVNVFATVAFNYDIANIMMFNKAVMAMARSVSFSQSSLWANRKNNEVSGDSSGTNQMADILIGELRSSIGYYRMQSEDSIDAIYLMGKSGLKEISDKFQEAEYEVRVLQPYSNISVKSSTSGLNAFKANDYTVAVSLGIRGLEG